METIAELEPTKKKHKLNKVVNRLRKYVDLFDIPESPLGKPVAHSVLLASYLREALGVDVIPHIRVQDLNKTALLSIIGGLEFIGINKVVLLRGDPVSNDSTKLTVEEAAFYAKNYYKKLKVGAIVSLRYPTTEILKRVGNRYLDFFLVLRASQYEDKLRIIRQHSSTKKIYVYVIIATEKNLPFLREMLNDQPLHILSEVSSFVDRVRGFADGVVLSCPFDTDAIVEVSKLVKKLD